MGRAGSVQVQVYTAHRKTAAKIKGLNVWSSQLPKSIGIAFSTIQLAADDGKNDLFGLLSAMDDRLSALLILKVLRRAFGGTKLKHLP